MKNNFSAKCLVVISILGLLACQNTFGPRENLGEELRELHSKAKTASSQELTQSGERAIEIADAAAMANDLASDGVDNLSVSAFEESLMFFEMALEKDRGNEKALFYLSLLRPFRSLKGTLQAFAKPTGNEQINNYFLDPVLEDSNIEMGLVRYLSTPSKLKPKNYRDVVNFYVVPLLHEFENSREGFDRLLTNPEFDFEVTLPKDFKLLKDIRIRHADLKVVRSMYVYFYLLGRAMAAYQTTGIPISQLADMNEEQRNIIDLRDPAFGVLLDPEVFKLIKQDILGVIEGLSLAEEEFKQRLASNQNSKKDLIQANRRRVMKCRLVEKLVIGPLNSTPVANSNRDDICIEPTEAETPLMLTVFESWDRRYFDNTFDDQTLQASEELQEFRDLNEQGSKTEDLKMVFAKVHEYLAGPVENSFDCIDEKGKYTTDRVWVDFAKFAEHPVRDLKKLKPKYLSGRSIDEIYYLTDPTIGGLFHPHVPCYTINQKRSRL